ncbi:GAF domain-containing protein [Hymenobacter wooponensis]|uniref:GAF domain-containing protein n=1 Tax=Hymenobacter wooponensis TaxID=1525360 RepID=A0A4Z0MBN5_9BACT|nr:GAF domain-containing protein [Hymenobacter wooponensis]TGD76790.1 GAF domain-containing protein [Hymenobacter wooponensis]
MLSSSADSDELERLRTLQYYQILNSMQEPVFTRFVALCAQIFNTPVSLISLVEEEQVQYIATHGIEVTAKVPRPESICSMAVEQNKAILLTDLTGATPKQVRAEARAASLRNGLPFYAGSPLHMPDKRSIGALCIGDVQPRSFSNEEQEVLDRLAALVAQTIVVRHFCLVSTDLGIDQWERVQHRMVDEIEALSALVRYIITRAGTQIPVPTDVLQLITRRLMDLAVILGTYQVNR